MDITWTDGAHLRYRTKAGWNWHMILQRNAAEGPTNVRLFPLSFEDSDSRVSYFAAAESLEPYGPIVQRAFAVSYLPSSLRTDGTAAGPVEDYLGHCQVGAKPMKLATIGRVRITIETQHLVVTISRFSLT